MFTFIYFYSSCNMLHSKYYLVFRYFPLSELHIQPTVTSFNKQNNSQCTSLWNMNIMKQWYLYQYSVNLKFSLQLTTKYRKSHHLWPLTELIEAWSSFLLQANLANVRELKRGMKNLHTDKIANFSAVLTKAFELLQQVRYIITNNSVYHVIKNY